MSRIENRVVAEGSRVLIKYLPHSHALFYLTLLLILPDKKVFEHSLREGGEDEQRQRQKKTREVAMRRFMDF